MDSDIVNKLFSIFWIFTVMLVCSNVMCMYTHGCLQKPGTEQVCALLPALELMLGQWKEEMVIMVELCQLAREHEDPHTISVVKCHFLNPVVPKVKLLGDLLTNAHKVGCTYDSTGGFGEYLIDQLYKELSSA